MLALSVVIPAYNEEQAIISVVERIKALSLQAEIIVVDDGSLDRTALRAESAGATVLRHPVNTGVGSALKTGIAAAQSDTIATADADGTYPVEMLPLLLQKLEEGASMVIGERKGPTYQGSFVKKIARFLLRCIAEFFTGTHIPDINSGLRVFRKRDILPLFPHLCNVFSFPTTLTLCYCFLGMRIAYVPISYAERIGASKVRIFRDSLRTLWYVIQITLYFKTHGKTTR